MNYFKLLKLKSQAILFSILAIMSLTSYADVSKLKQPKNLSDDSWASLQEVYKQTIDDEINAVKLNKIIIAAESRSFGSSVDFDPNLDIAIVGQSQDNNADGRSAGTAFIYSFNGSSWTQQAQLLPTDGTASNLFGNEVVIDGQWAVVSSPKLNNFSTESSIHFYRKVSGVWQFFKRIVIVGDSGGLGLSLSLIGDSLMVASESTRTVNEYMFDGSDWVLDSSFSKSLPTSFATTIARGASATRVAVGARNDSTISTTKGALYIYEKIAGTWTEIVKLNPSSANNGLSIGRNIDLGGANDDVLIAAGESTGNVTVFKKSGLLWSEVTVLTSAPGNLENAIKINANGLIVVLHSKRIDIFEPFGFTNYIHTVDNAAIEGQVGVTRDHLALKGNEILIGNYTFNNKSVIYQSYNDFSNTLNPDDSNKYIKKQLTNNNDDFGVAVDVSGQWAVIGAPKHDQLGSNSGAAYVFQFNSAWRRYNKLVASDGQAGDQFGRSVAIDGDRLVVGAYLDDYKTGFPTVIDAGSAYVFEFDGANWVETAKLKSGKSALTPSAAGDLFGFSVDVKGDRILVGAHKDETQIADGGVAYVFDYDGLNWLRTPLLKPGIIKLANAFGYNVSLDTDQVLIGAYLDDDLGTNTGAAYVWNYNGSSWSQTAKIIPSSSIGVYPDSHFGTAVAIQGDTAIIGASLDRDLANTQTQGRVHQFHKNTSGVWNLIVVIDANDINAGDRFGYALDMQGNRLIIGAWRHNHNGIEVDSGSSYLYERANATAIFTETQEILPNIAHASDFFGVDVALNNNVTVNDDWLLIGSHRYDVLETNNDNSGSVSILNLSPVFRLTGTISGLIGTNTVNILDGLMVKELAVDNGSYQILNYVEGDTYSIVGLSSNSNSPAQTCTTINSTGTVGSSDVTGVDITCVIKKFKVSGTVTGYLPTVSNLLIYNNNDALNDFVLINADGTFEFDLQDDLTNFAVTVPIQPTNPNQNCIVTGGNSSTDDGTGTFAGADVTDVVISCSLTSHSVGGMVTGLAPGASMSLQINGSDDLSISSNGSFTFNTPIVYGTLYAVSVLTSPTVPHQTCVVTGGSSAMNNGSGTLFGDVTDILVTCATDQFTIGGTLTGLVSSTFKLVINNELQDATQLTSNGAYQLNMPVDDLASYQINISDNPASPNQTCIISGGSSGLNNGSGTINNANDSSVNIDCSLTTYSVGGSITGLAIGASVILKNNGGDDLTLFNNGAFQFNTGITDGSSYSVIVSNQPNLPHQTCVVTGGDDNAGSGMITSADVNTVAINCTTNQFNLTLNINGYTSVGGSFLVNFNGNNLAIMSPGVSHSELVGTFDDQSSYNFSLTSYDHDDVKTCTIDNGVGVIANAHTIVDITCVDRLYKIGGFVSGLATASEVVFNLAQEISMPFTTQETLAVNVNGEFEFIFQTGLNELSFYNINDNGNSLIPFTIHPTNPNQFCTSSLLAVPPIGFGKYYDVNCVTQQYTVGGNVTGLSSMGLVLQNNGSDDLSINADGMFTFATSIDDGSGYFVSVKIQPASQTCVVNNPTGDIAGADFSTISIQCVSAQFTIGGTITGLATGSSVTLQNQGADDLLVNTNGSFTFGSTYVDGSNYNITVSSQPTNPNQTCLASLTFGSISGTNVTNVTISCFTTKYKIKGVVSGLAQGSSFFLQRNGSNNIQITANGAYEFGLSVNDGSFYEITIPNNPVSPNQLCVVANPSGTINGADVTNVNVTCTLEQFAIKVNVLGLFAGNDFSIQNNGGDDLLINQNGSSTFNTALDDGSAYAVTVISKPTTPSQTCVVSNGSGNVSGAVVQNILIQCTTDKFTIGGNITGLATGSSVEINNLNTDNKIISANGAFVFNTSISDLQSYNVKVVTQPTSPNQTCTATNATGVINASNITDVAINCVTQQYSVNVNVSGLQTGSSLALKNNGINTLLLSQNGVASFTTMIDDGSVYDVTVSQQPTSPNQTCVVNNATGNVSGANVTNITVVCQLTQYSVGGMITGLATGNSITLTNNGIDNLLLTANGSFEFSTQLDDFSSYLVEVQTQPTTPNQICTITNEMGTINANNVINVTVNCITQQYSVSVNVSGLQATTSLTLLNNGVNDLVISQNGMATFTNMIDDGAAYEVTVSQQPTSPNQTCVVSNPSGAIAGVNVTNITINCVLTQYSIGGTLSGLAVGNTVSLINNNSENLIVNANGSFTFATQLDDASIYSVNVSIQPTTPNQTCDVVNNSGLINGQNIVDISVTCTTNPYNVSGTLLGLATGNDLVLQNNGGDDLFLNANGIFTFANQINDGNNYAVTVLTLPTTPNQSCNVTGGNSGADTGTGFIAGGAVLDIVVICTSNSAPVAVTDNFITNEDITLNVPLNQSVLINDTDAESDALVVVTTGVFNTAGIGGSINMSADGTFTYTPPADLSGIATFNYEISDGNTNVSANLSITINAVNDAPSFDIIGDVQNSQLTTNTATVQIPGFVNNIVFGPSDESTQTVSSINANILSDSAGVINSISISNNGTLTINYSLNFGTALVNVNLVDNGGISNNGENTSINIEFNVSYIDIVFANGFEMIQAINIFEYIDEFKTYNSENYPIYDFASDALILNDHYLELNNNYEKSQLPRVKSWLKEVSLIDGIYLIIDF